MRLFVAVYPPLDLVRSWQGCVKTCDPPAFRMTPEDQVHLTLQFLGEVSRGDIDSTRESVERATAGVSAFDLTVRRLIRLPERRRARLLAVETDAPAPLLEIQRRLAGRLARAPRRRPGDRFLPHFTVCRFRRPSALGVFDETLPPATFTVAHVCLTKSVLHSEGAQHTTIMESKLRAGR